MLNITITPTHTALSFTFLYTFEREGPLRYIVNIQNMVRWNRIALSSVLASFMSTAIAFTAQTRSNTKSFVTVSSNSCVNRNLNVCYNVPADISDWDTVKSAADREPPPSSFFVLQENSVKAAKLAIDQGERLIEVEYPPLPADVLESEDVSAYDVSKANVRLAVEFAKSFAVEYDMETAILVPDEAELAIAVSLAVWFLDKCLVLANF